MTELVAAGHGFQKWLSSKSSTALLDVWNDTMLGSVASREQYEACCKQLFGPYCPQPDVAGWLLGVAVLAESLPLSLTVSDCMIAGQPLVYVNAKFTEVTGYTKIDCAGRNCRFLQGPGTNPEHGQHLLDTLRNGEDSQTLLLNYRKSGEPFENLLTMRFVCDNLGRRRFCVGFQLDLTGLKSDPGPWGAERLATEEGMALMTASRIKMSKLIQMLPKQISVPVPETPSTAMALKARDGAWRCPQLASLADALGVAMRDTTGLKWSEALFGLLSQSNEAVIVVDMNVAMLPISFASEGFARLTGWSVGEVMGKNCRFLQSPQTEGVALSRMITAIRQRESCLLQITNARKDGSPFVNELSLHPVHDSDGSYRFNIGVLTDASVGASPRCNLLRSKLPTAFDAELQPLNFLGQFGVVPPLDQWRQYQPMTTKLMRLLWSTDNDGTMRKFLTIPEALSSPAIASLGQFMSSKGLTEDEKRLVLLVTQQMSGAWDAMEGRRDQKFVSG